MDTKCINQKISKVRQNDRKKLDSTGTKTVIYMHNIQKYSNRNTGSSYFQTHLKNVAEDCKAILRYKTKISCMSKKSSKVLKNKNKQGMLSRSKIAQKLILVPGFWKSKSCFRIISSKIPCMLIFRKNENFWLVRPKFAQKWILRSEFRKSQCNFGISTSKILRVSIFR